MKRVTDIENSEVAWVLYDFKRRDEEARFSMSSAEFYLTEWADVEVALREGVPPKQQEILEDVYAAMTRKKAPMSILRERQKRAEVIISTSRSAVISFSYLSTVIFFTDVRSLKWKVRFVEREHLQTHGPLSPTL